MANIPRANGDRAIQCFCQDCGVVKVFHQKPEVLFPDTGWWDECKVCGQYRMFFRIRNGRVINKQGVPGRVRGGHPIRKGNGHLPQ